MATASAVADKDLSLPGNEEVTALPRARAEIHMQAIHQENGGALLAFLRRLVPTGAAHTADDLMQETMLRTWRYLDSVPAESEARRRWLFTVARRIAIDTYRKRKTQPTEVSLMDIDPIHAGIDVTGTVIANLELRNAIGRLSNAHRAVLAGLYADGHSMEEVAARLHIPVGTVKSRAHYAVQAIRDALSNP